MFARVSDEWAVAKVRRWNRFRKWVIASFLAYTAGLVIAAAMMAHMVWPYFTNLYAWEQLVFKIGLAAGCVAGMTLTAALFFVAESFAWFTDRHKDHLLVKYHDCCRTGLAAKDGA